MSNRSLSVYSIEASDPALHLLNIVINSTGLETDGSYKIPTSSNYIKDAKSLHHAHIILDSQININEESILSTQNGAGLETDGSYIPPPSSNYIKDAKSLYEADNKLDIQINNEENNRKNADTTLNTKVDDTFNNILGLNEQTYSETELTILKDGTSVYKTTTPSDYLGYWIHDFSIIKFGIDYYKFKIDINDYIISELESIKNRHPSVIVATTENLSFSQKSYAIGGVQIYTEGQRILVKNQTDKKENGIYISRLDDNSNIYLERANNTPLEFKPGSYVKVDTDSKLWMATNSETDIDAGPNGEFSFNYGIKFVEYSEPSNFGKKIISTSRGIIVDSAQGQNYFTYVIKETTSNLSELTSKSEYNIIFTPNATLPTNISNYSINDAFFFKNFKNSNINRYNITVGNIQSTPEILDIKSNDFETTDNYIVYKDNSKKLILYNHTNTNPTPITIYSGNNLKNYSIYEKDKNTIFVVYIIDNKYKLYIYKYEISKTQVEEVFDLTTKNNFRYRSDDSFGKNLKITKKHIAISAEKFNNKGIVHVIQYTDDLLGSFEYNEIINNTTMIGDNFGFSIDIYNPDIDNIQPCLVIGAPLTDTNGTDYGTVYIYKLNNNWVKTNTIQSDAKENKEYFGHSVNISPIIHKDINDYIIFVAATGYSSSNSVQVATTGKVYAFFSKINNYPVPNTKYSLYPVYGSDKIYFDKLTDNPSLYEKHDGDIKYIIDNDTNIQKIDHSILYIKEKHVNYSKIGDYILVNIPGTPNGSIYNGVFIITSISEGICTLKRRIDEDPILYRYNINSQTWSIIKKYGYFRNQDNKYVLQNNSYYDKFTPNYYSPSNYIDIIITDIQKDIQNNVLSVDKEFEKKVLKADGTKYENIPVVKGEYILDTDKPGKIYKINDITINNQSISYHLSVIPTTTTQYNIGSGNIDTTGEIICARFYSKSDKRYKENIKNINTNVSSLVSKIQPVTYNMKKNKGITDIGLIAQDVQKIFPYLVKEDNNGMLSMAYDKLSVYLLKAFNEQQKRIEKLEKIIDNKD